MKISEILSSLTTIQQQVAGQRGFASNVPGEGRCILTEQVEYLCNLSTQLAIHIQQLEIDRDALKGHKLERYDSRFDYEDTVKIKEEVIQAARWYVNLTGNIDDTICRTEEYKRLWGAVVAYNATIGAEEPLKTRR